MYDMKKALITLCCLAAIAACTARKPQYRVCAYVWPSCHDDSLAHSWLWADGEGASIVAGMVANGLMYLFFC